MTTPGQFLGSLFGVGVGLKLARSARKPFLGSNLVMIGVGLGRGAHVSPNPTPNNNSNFFPGVVIPVGSSFRRVVIPAGGSS